MCGCVVFGNGQLCCMFTVCVSWLVVSCFGGLNELISRVRSFLTLIVFGMCCFGSWQFVDTVFEFLGLVWVSCVGMAVYMLIVAVVLLNYVSVVAFGNGE